MLQEAARPAALTAESLLALARDCGADDCGLVAIDDPAIVEERPHVLAAFAATRTLVVLVQRMNREPVRSPARSVANLEFHTAGHEVDAVARKLVRRLEDMGVPALNPAMAFPMEMERFPEPGWVVSHKRVAEAAGLGKMGLHRSLIHPKFGSFVLLGTVLVDAEVGARGRPLDFNPCFECKLCVAACPVGALKPDGYFDFSACMTHNYQQFMGGFVNFVEDVAASRSVSDFRTKQSFSETVVRWQSLTYGANYNAAYCVAVCPAGEDVIGAYRADRRRHLTEIVDPLTAKREPVFVSPNTDAADYVAKRFPHKTIRWSRPGARATSIRTFLQGAPLTFQPGKAAGLEAVYHFVFTGRDAAEATLTVANRRLVVREGLHGRANLTVTADGVAWVRFLNKELSLARALLTRRIRLRGSPRLLAAFGKCFPA